ncbi:ATP-binding protein [Nocardioides mangrovi]|uniref:histidine kinase n=1 Tax=Nocardioides mangrovi TaxID=2874580 RepID=A0ABS7U8V1_9ACTN|nr:ATP-binding protein [Nocardioides mangrovi]MBZ5737404.1 PAS domain S-box protein [Nocardioides mangrovi]
MVSSWVVRVVVLFGATALFGLSAVHSTPDGGTAIGIWPIGLATGCLLVTTRPPTAVLLVLTGVIGVATIATERDNAVAIGIGIGMAIEVGVVWWILTGGRRERPELFTSGDLSRLVLATTVGSLVGGTAAMVTSALSGWGEPWVLGLAVGASNLASQLILVPFFCLLRNHDSAAGPTERSIQWLAVLVASPLVFAPHDFPSVVFVLIPLLAWCALRTRPFEALAQMLAVEAFAILMTSYGRGPFANAGKRYGFSADSQGILLASFLIVCALVVVPLMLAVGEQIENARLTATERDKVQNIVNGIANVAIIGTNSRGEITLFNPGAVRLLGYAEDDMLGRTTRHLHSDTAIATKAEALGTQVDFSAVAQAMMGIGSTDMGFVRADGVERMHSMSLNRVKDDRGEVTGYVSTSEDITERVEAERKLVAALETEREALERMREVDQVKDAFVSSVSHELRTPITSILGYLEMLEDGAYGRLAPDQQDAVRRVAANSSRLLSLIDDLLTLSRIQDGGIGFLDRVVDLRKTVAAGCAVVAPALEHRDLTLDVSYPEDPVPFLGDRDMLERVVINLVGNAVKFTPEGGKVNVDLSLEDEIVIAVSDTGIGIPPQEVELLFSRFFRSSLAQERAIPGSGLGLSITHAIVEQHGGSIGVESEPGVGTTFRVRLPLLGAA